ncbi:two-component sensor histidine kinase [Rugamonas sp. FT107W]|uniref:histidine kinase n=1 Tax=Duganella vulcania TaxID=2692166 RepID=A0A845HGH1_9BURK|nr:ATP-binding protein [Duganella vulcania]MYN16034.1 two-component sensor histidine kinase [Duganella vulcania]
MSALRSLQARLALCLAGVMLVAAGIAGTVSYRTAFHEVNELQDDQLRQMSALAKRRHLATPYGLQDLDNQVVDVGARIMVQVLHQGAWGDVEGAELPLPLAADLPDGLQTLEVQGQQRRLFLRTLPGGERVAVSQGTAVRDEVAHNAGKTTIVPIAALIPVLALAMIALIRHMLAPVLRLAQELDRRGDDQLAPLDDSDVPSEVLPFTAAINRLLHRVELALAQQRRFVADAAHELRTPLTAISLQAELLAGLNLGEQARPRLQSLQRGILRARHLVAQLLLLARLQGREDAHRDAVAVGLVCQSVLEDLLPLADHKQIVLTANVDMACSVRSDAMDLSAVLRNLIDNAIRYTQPGGQVGIDIAYRGAALHIHVSDNGPGVPEHERELVLSPFYRGAAATGSGSGLGLAIVHNIVQRMAGTVALNASGPGAGGLTVRIALPIPSTESPALPTPDVLHFQ